MFYLRFFLFSFDDTMTVMNLTSKPVFLCEAVEYKTMHAVESILITGNPTALGFSWQCDWE